MYETRLSGSGSAGSGSSTQSAIGVLLNAATVVVLGYLLFKVFEPFVSSALASSREVRWKQDVKEISKALKRFRMKEGAYRTTDFEALGGYLSQVPNDPWGVPYQYDPFFRTIHSAGPDGAFAEDPFAESDDLSFPSVPLPEIWVHWKDGETPSLLRLRLDGAQERSLLGSEPDLELAHVLLTTDKRWIQLLQKLDGTFSARLGLGADAVSIGPWPGEPKTPTLGPGEEIYFSSAPAGEKPRIGRVNLSGGALTWVTEKPEDPWEVFEGDLHPSLDQKNGHLALTTYRKSQSPQIGFVSRARPGGSVKVLREGYPGGSQPTWAKSGRGLLYLAEEAPARLLQISFPPKRNSIQEVPLPFRPSLWVLGPEEERLLLVENTATTGELHVFHIPSRKVRRVLSLPGNIQGLGFFP